MSCRAMKRHEETLNVLYIVEETSRKGYILYDSNCMTFWKS